MGLSGSAPREETNTKWRTPWPAAASTRLALPNHDPSPGMHGAGLAVHGGAGHAGADVAHPGEDLGPVRSRRWRVGLTRLPRRDGPPAG